LILLSICAGAGGGPSRVESLAAMAHSELYSAAAAVYPILALAVVVERPLRWDDEQTPQFVQVFLLVLLALVAILGFVACMGALASNNDTPLLRAFVLGGLGTLIAITPTAPAMTYLIADPLTKGMFNRALVWAGLAFLGLVLLSAALSLLDE
jgi:hypothetical protein